MRIGFSMCPPENVPAGGGAKFVLGFKDFLIERGHKVEFGLDLKNPPDLIFMFDPRHLGYSRNWLTIQHIRQLQDDLGVSIPIVHRMNDIGAPKDRPPSYVSDMIELANRSKHVVFISDWLREYYEKKGKISTNADIIYNGVDKETFFPKKYDFDGKVKLVTHHWSNNFLKGWDIYKKIDEWLEGQHDVEFTFIGNVAKDVQLKNSTVIQPLSSKPLAEELRKHNVYITASRSEPCGMHHIEGIASGLPILYHKEGGGIVEAGEKYGLGFENFEDFKSNVEEIRQKHKKYYNKIIDEFDNYAENIYKKYYNIIEGAI